MSQPTSLLCSSPGLPLFTGLKVVGRNPSRGSILSRVKASTKLGVIHYQLNELGGEVAVRCFVGALSGLWLWWVRHDYPHPATEMIHHFDALMNNGTWP